MPIENNRGCVTAGLRHALYSNYAAVWGFIPKRLGANVIRFISVSPCPYFSFFSLEFDVLFSVDGELRMEMHRFAEDYLVVGSR